MCIQCGNCLSNDPCNSTTGICADGCADGWRGGNCTEGRFMYMYIYIGK